jgi:outer membrane lipoprotein-sorting protein
MTVFALSATAQDADQLIREVRAKLEQVKDYKATGKLKTDVDFLKIPVSNVQVYYRKPDRFKVRKDDGISLLPKNGVSINLNALLMTGEYTAVPAGQVTMDGKTLTVVKLLPMTEGSDVVLTTMYIDAKKKLINKAVTTTRDNGTYDMQMSYGKFEKYGLPDKVIFTFNTKDYKLPKGVTFEYDAGATAKAQQPKSNKGKVEITYSDYEINKGISDSMFK